jgi:hypothetical protein
MTRKVARARISGITALDTKPMKPVYRATVISESLLALQVAVKAALGDERALRVLRSDIGGTPVAERLATLATALQEILDGEKVDQALGITRKRGASSKRDLYSLALQVQAWQAENKSPAEIESLARAEGIYLSADRLSELPREFATKITRFHELKSLLETDLASQAER